MSRARVDVSGNQVDIHQSNLDFMKFSFFQVPNFWSDVRQVSKPDVWLWLGDNMYQDGNDIDAKVNIFPQIGNYNINKL